MLTTCTYSSSVSMAIKAKQMTSVHTAYHEYMCVFGSEAHLCSSISDWSFNISICFHRHLYWSSIKDVHDCWYVLSILMCRNYTEEPYHFSVLSSFCNTYTLWKCFVVSFSNHYINIFWMCAKEEKIFKSSTYSCCDLSNTKHDRYV